MESYVQHIYKCNYTQIMPMNHKSYKEVFLDYKNLPLIFSVPCIVNMGDSYYPVDKEGLYRFFDINNRDMRQVYFYHEDVWQLVGNLSQMHVHSWRGHSGRETG